MNQERQSSWTSFLWKGIDFVNFNKVKGQTCFTLIYQTELVVFNGYKDQNHTKYNYSTKHFIVE